MGAVSIVVGPRVRICVQLPQRLGRPLAAAPDGYQARPHDVRQNGDLEAV
jgi:hypothetical protein